MPRDIPQAGVIAVHGGLICLVTSRSGGRWVIPKGKIEAKQTALEAAKQEAWEEAGVVGDLQAMPVGSFRYRKLERDHEVSVYVMSVKLIAEKWPEQYFRNREWVTPEEAVRRVVEPELQVLLQMLFVVPRD